MVSYQYSMLASLGIFELIYLFSGKFRPCLYYPITSNRPGEYEYIYYIILILKI